MKKRKYMNKILAIAGASLLSILPIQTATNGRAVGNESIANKAVNVYEQKAGTDSITHSLYSKPTVSIYPTTLNQGKTAFIEVKTCKDLNHPYYVFNNKKIPLYKDSKNLYSGLIGTDPNQKAGETIIVLEDEGKNLSDTIKLLIKKVQFGKQSITTTKAVSKLTATDDEQAIISKALNTKSDIKYFSDSKFQIPTVGTYKSAYGVMRIENGVYKNSFHKGIDISAPTGTAIKSLQPGKVLVAEQFRLNGGTVIVDHGHGMTSAYLHMSKICVKAGQLITLNDTIGKVGSTGHSTGPHLHFGLYINGTAVNPIQFLDINALKHSNAKKTATKLIKSVAKII